MEILTKEQCVEKYGKNELSRKQYEEEWHKRAIYDKFYDKEAPRIFTNFWLWSKTKGYDICFGDLKKAWAEYLEVKDFLPVETARDYLMGDSETNEVYRQAFNDYCKKYIEEIRGMRK